ncbi:hypothetical protein EW146_g8471 [Bondarzewia mesenterica]|uniref:Alpha-type protein kinase domain-containing protein n=1 Tax=Bondarzewia mesenterica TaxID=1095465 RepID=A0A4S4LFX9_9AGAM|nr:hypothetical protein EW146_g8471 [Bondarzewia mesenterica]
MDPFLRTVPNLTIVDIRPRATLPRSHCMAGSQTFLSQVTAVAMPSATDWVQGGLERAIFSALPKLPVPDGVHSGDCGSSKVTSPVPPLPLTLPTPPKNGNGNGNRLSKIASAPSFPRRTTRLLNGCIYGTPRPKHLAPNANAKNLFANVRDEEPDSASANAGGRGVSWSHLQSDEKMVVGAWGRSDDRGRSAARRGVGGRDEDDDGSGMAWVRKRKEEKMRRERERVEAKAKEKKGQKEREKDKKKGGDEGEGKKSEPDTVSEPPSSPSQEEKDRAEHVYTAALINFATTSYAVHQPVKKDMQVRADQTQAPIFDGASCGGKLSAAQIKLRVVRARLNELDKQASSSPLGLSPDLEAERGLLKARHPYLGDHRHMELWVSDRPLEKPTSGLPTNRFAVAYQDLAFWSESEWEDEKTEDSMSFSFSLPLHDLPTSHAEPSRMRLAEDDENVKNQLTPGRRGAPLADRSLNSAQPEESSSSSESINKPHMSKGAHERSAMTSPRHGQQTPHAIGFIHEGCTPVIKYRAHAKRESALTLEFNSPAVAEIKRRYNWVIVKGHNGCGGRPSAACRGGRARRAKVTCWEDEANVIAQSCFKRNGIDTSAGWREHFIGDYLLGGYEFRGCSELLAMLEDGGELGELGILPLHLHPLQLKQSMIVQRARLFCLLQLRGMLNAMRGFVEKIFQSSQFHLRRLHGGGGGSTKDMDDGLVVPCRPRRGSFEQRSMIRCQCGIALSRGAQSCCNSPSLILAAPSSSSPCASITAWVTITPSFFLACTLGDCCRVHCDERIPGTTTIYRNNAKGRANQIASPLALPAFPPARSAAAPVMFAAPQAIRGQTAAAQRGDMSHLVRAVGNMGPPTLPSRGPRVNVPGADLALALPPCISSVDTILPGGYTESHQWYNTMRVAFQNRVYRDPEVAIVKASMRVKERNRVNAMQVGDFKNCILTMSDVTLHNSKGVEFLPNIPDAIYDECFATKNGKKKFQRDKEIKILLYLEPNTYKEICDRHLDEEENEHANAMVDVHVATHLKDKIAEGVHSQVITDQEPRHNDATIGLFSNVSHHSYALSTSIGFDFNDVSPPRSEHVIPKLVASQTDQPALRPKPRPMKRQSHEIRPQRTFDQLIESPNWRDEILKTAPVATKLHYDLKSKGSFGAFKKAQMGRLGDDVFNTGSNTIAIKQAFYQNSGSNIRIFYDSREQAKELVMEMNCLVWADALMNLVYDFIKDERIRRDESCPFDIPHLRFVHIGLAIAQKQGSDDRLTCLVEEWVDAEVEGPFRSSACTLFGLCAHLQFWKTGGQVFIADFQGGNTLLSDPQIITNPKVGENIFADGNYKLLYKNFPTEHECNIFCVYYRLPHLRTLLPKSIAGSGTLGQTLREPPIVISSSSSGKRVSGAEAEMANLPSKPLHQ